MTRILCLLGLALTAGSAFAQGPDNEPPVANRPVDFSNIVGKYTIKVSAAPTEARVEDPIILRIEITGSGPKEYEPDRKYLKLFPESFEKDFYVQELRDQHKVDRDRKTWLFVYQIKPKHVNATAIDEIKLVYYDPVLKIFPPKYAKRIELKVGPKPDKSEEIVLTDLSVVPDSFYSITESRDVLTRSGPFIVLSGPSWALLLILPPVVCVAGVFAWRRLFPHEAEQARQYRLASASRAVAQLQAGKVAASVIVSGYLSDRFDFAVEDPTPAEVFSFLKRRGFALVRCAQAQAFFQACDAARYTAAAAPVPRDEAVRLIQALEADPCA
jgi:hypothetical protein